MKKEKSNNNVPVSEDYKVWSDLIKAHFAGKSNAPIIILDQAKLLYFGTPEEAESHFKLFSKVPIAPALLSDFKERNKTEMQLTNSFSLENCQLISIEQWRKIVSSGSAGWADFQKRYCNAQGIIIVSRVGFDSQKKTAFVCIDLESERNYATTARPPGYCFLAKKENEKWVAKDKYSVLFA